MPRTNIEERYIGEIELTQPREGVIEGHYRPSRFAYELQTRPEYREPELPTRHVLTFDREANRITMHPITIYPGTYFLKSRYGRVDTIIFEGHCWTLPEDVADLPRALADVPDPFYRSPEAGLGVPRVAAPIMKAIREVKSATTLVISKHRQSAIEGPTVIISAADFSEAATVMERISRRHQDRSLEERMAFAHNILLSRHFPKDYPEVRPPYTPGSIADTLNVVVSSKVKLDREDREVLVNEVEKRVADMAAGDPERLFQLQKNIELVTLDNLISKVTRLLEPEGSAETRWQNLFELNPFILTQIFGYPIVQVRSQATVGAPLLDGAGAKIADFVVRNQSTNNAALVEIKRPDTPLLLKSPYRGEEGRNPIYPASTALTGAVLQVLDQSRALKERIATILYENRGLALEAYHIDCVVVAGRLPTEPDEIRSFEMYRNSFKDVRIITFDELLRKLEALRELLVDTGGDLPEQVDQRPASLPRSRVFPPPDWAKRSDFDPLDFDAI